MDKRRGIFLLLFVGLTAVLLPYFFLQTQRAVPSLLSPLVNSVAKVLPISSQVTTTPEGKLVISRLEKKSAKPLVASEVLERTSEYRSRFGYNDLAANDDLITITQRLTDAIAKNIDTYDDMPFETLIESYAHDSKTALAAISHVSVVGPTSSDEAFAAFVADVDQSEILLDSDAEIIAVATGAAEYQQIPVGITVIMFAQKAPKNQTTQATVPVARKQAFPEISDTSMIVALNEYRRAHGIPQLIEHPLLCQYAQKRVEDLVAFGGLDGHAGFQKDFEDLNNLPEPIKQYPGGKIGENLAYQNCRNMTTGDGFVAQTATALIEWCFDSSTKGHREAQLNPKFTAVCSRHQDGLFAVIFGE
ncbi:MAG: hypothetical protein COU67_02680 [Candidatus Pacebacteria bacterium CG10_big_fil_rev_8_21_14_0_10_44_54]|nr:MAG: hypothetical protein COU67_02680 [Candidatus Pacebacteria bacterium CG10_big_fil_rev_8_21_14_0_10_44_54]